MIYLITNSDDFGMNEAITDAIVETHLNGIMTSTTLMANMPGFDYAVNKSKEIKTLGVGIHFNLTEGNPVSSPGEVGLLLDENGKFLSNKLQRKNLLHGKDVLRQAKIELNNQLTRLLDHGVTPTHFDSHHHITGTPVAFEASMLVAKSHNLLKARATNISVRVKAGKSKSLKTTLSELKSLPKAWLHAHNKSTLRRNGITTPDTKVLPDKVIPVLPDKVSHFIDVLQVLKPGVTEISFHPGYPNSVPLDSERTARLRISDFEIATSPLVKEFIQKNNIHLISFRDI